MSGLHRILLIDDDERLATMLQGWLAGHGFAVEHAPTLATGRAALARGDQEALVLDLMLPDGDGMDLCRELRARSDLPMLILSARGEELDRVLGLELGADDFLAKPFAPRELVARLRALLRRARPRPEAHLRFGALELDPSGRSARLGGRRLDLTTYQFALLRALAERAGRVLGREQLIELAGGDPGESFDRSVDVHISRIRAQLEADPREPRWIRTVRGAGYLFTGQGS
jgi:DNA-binding response OmpR family regulator